MNDVFVNSTSCSAFANRVPRWPPSTVWSIGTRDGSRRRRLEEPDATHMRYVVRR